MILFLKHIPKGTPPSELHDFVAPALKGNLFSRSGRILKVEILVILDTRTNVYEFHGLVRVDSEQAGQRAIKKLQGKRFKNKPIFVRKYEHRSWHNDRRHGHKLMPGQIEVEKRGHDRDRRRGSNVKVMVTIQPFSSPHFLEQKMRQTEHSGRFLRNDLRDGTNAS